MSIHPTFSLSKVFVTVIARFAHDAVVAVAAFAFILCPSGGGYELVYILLRQSIFGCLSVAPPQSRIITVLDGIISATLKFWVFGYFSPLVSVNFMLLENNKIFLLAPRRFMHVRTQMIMPPLTTLLTGSNIFAQFLAHLLGNKSPFFGTLFTNQPAEKRILFSTPGLQT